ncbi:MAG TPA: NUDIX domain-containing protein [Acidimicrobiales bacterium]|nr:NUDIX domain-containing protein [Acidimicrobiales bacterium]
MGVSPYIRTLRRSIGHDLLLLPAVAVLPFDEEGRVLLVRQSDDGLWATIGGSVEPDESPHEAAVRETAEETGLVVELDGIRAALGGRRLRARYPNGDECSYVATVFSARVTGGVAKADGDEVLELAWFPPGALPVGEMNDLTRAVLEGAGLLPPPPG